jgi:MoaA/NifB/PqqE/SkfB family radical SAM enzyme
MALNLSILYRGPLSSCNYGCEYCPFAKRSETAAQLTVDRKALERFVDWVAARHADQIGILFTPWGEALIHPWYQQAMARLSHLPQVVKVAIQTNLSCGLDWVDRCDKQKLGLWTTYHPTEVDRDRFVRQCWELDRRGVRFSVGIVGLKEHQAEAQALRQELPAHIYLWVNAYKREPNYYSTLEIERFTAIDPLFPINNQIHPSLGKSCRAGDSAIAVDGDGTMRRCHFIPAAIGNIYASDFEQNLMSSPCTNQTCRCHIGYVHMHELGLYEVFGSGILERIPEKISCRHNS